jgi:hypothetical protein
MGGLVLPVRIGLEEMNSASPRLRWSGRREVNATLYSLMRSAGPLNPAQLHLQKLRSREWVEPAMLTTDAEIVTIKAWAF